MQAVLDMLGGSFEGVIDASLMPWAQLAWGAGGSQADASVAAFLVQRLDWQDMAFHLPGAFLSLHNCTLEPCSSPLLCFYASPKFG